MPNSKFYTIVKGVDGAPQDFPFLAWIRANQNQFEIPIQTPNTHIPFKKLIQLGWQRRDYNGNVYGIQPDENGEFDYSEPFFDNEVLPDPEEDENDLEDIIPNNNIAIGLEKDLQRSLRLNINSLENGLEIIDGGFERQLFNGGRVDILAKDPNDHLVVIELKAGKAKPEALAQILDYVADLRRETQSEVRGIIVAHDFDRRLENAGTETHQIKLKKYSIRFEFEEV